MNNINLVPSQYKKAYSRKWFIIFGILGVVCCIMILIFLSFIPINKIKKEENRQISLEKSLKSKEIEGIKNIINEINIKESEKQKLVSILNDIGIHSSVTKQTMDIIVGNAPKGLRMNTINIKNLDKTIYITGKAKHSKNIVEYIILLYNTNQFQHISYRTKQQDKTEEEEWVEYSIEIQGHNVTKEAKDLEIQGIFKESEEIEGGGIL